MLIIGLLQVISIFRGSGPIVSIAISLGLHCVAKDNYAKQG